MKKITFAELVDLFYQHNIDNNIKSQFDDPKALQGVVVFADSGANTGYSLENRSYRFSSDNKYFIPGMGGNSIYAVNLDRTDDIRLDWYIGHKSWQIDYCYIEEN